MFFSEDSINNGDYWILNNVKDISMIENSINNDKIGLNNNFNNVLENKSSMIFYLHFKANKNKLNNFNSCFSWYSKRYAYGELNIDYFKEQNCYFIMRTSYG